MKAILIPAALLVILLVIVIALFRAAHNQAKRGNVELARGLRCCGFMLTAFWVLMTAIVIFDAVLE